MLRQQPHVYKCYVNNRTFTNATSTTASLQMLRQQPRVYKCTYMDNGASIPVLISISGNLKNA